MQVSVVIPVYNEGKKVLRDITEAYRFFRDKSADLELIIVDDGSRDDTLPFLERTRVTEYTDLMLISYPKHKGKGHAIREGVRRASGDIILFIDSGYCIPFEEVYHGIDLVYSGAADIAHGSRFLPESHITRKKGPFRRMLSALFRKFITRYMKLPEYLTDSQCGLKIYRKEIAHELYRNSQINGFMIDIEIIQLALQRGYRIMEFPVTWTSDPDSRLRILPTFFRMFRDLQRIRERTRPS